MEARSSLKSVRDRPRVFIISDISNEPDDAESLVRYLLYANEFDTRGLVACTSTWMKRVVHPEDMEKIVKAFSKVVDNLNGHTHPDNPYPSADEMSRLIRAGPALYGKEALHPTVPLSSGSRLLLDRLEESPSPLWVLCWGGTNVLAQALQYISNHYSSKSAKLLLSKLRVYAISDQDDTGMWIRITYPEVFYISSVHGWNQYGLAAWTGISGEKYYGFDRGGPDFAKCTREWLKQHVQIGPLGSAYPDYMFIPEGDTPTFLYLIQNGLGSPEHPSWGSWGGRYLCTDLAEAGRHYTDAVDRVIGADGREYVSNHATIWRWRDAYQNDLAARMQWTLTPDFSKAQHHPVIVVKSVQQNDPNNPDSAATTTIPVSSFPGDPSPIHLTAEPSSTLIFDLSPTYDPDVAAFPSPSGEETLTFSWSHYTDPTAAQWIVPFEVPHPVVFDPLDPSGSARIVSAKMPPAEECAIDLFTRKPVRVGQVLHFVCEVKKKKKKVKERGEGAESEGEDLGLRSYKRFVVGIVNERLEEGEGVGKGVESILEAWRNR